MDIKSILPTKTQEKEHYWSIVIESDWVQSGIWKVEDGVVNVVAFGAPFSWQKDQDLVELVDSSLSVAIQNLADENIEPSKTVFGLPSSWVDGGQIRLQYQEKIKRVCQELSLKPVGFVSLTEAISYYLKSQEGDFLSAVIVAVGEEELSISLVVRGQNKGEFQVSRSVSLLEDLVEGLSRFSFNEAFPPRIILYDGREGELDNLREGLVVADWSKYETIKFLHTPKIEVLKPDEKILAVSLAGGVELEGAKEVKSLPFEKDEEVKDIKNVSDEAIEVKENDNFERLDENDIGFVVGEDIKNISEDVIGEKLVEDKEDIPLNENKPTLIKSQNSFLSLLKNYFLKLKENWPKRLVDRNFSNSSNFDKRPFIYGFISFLFLLVGGFAAWWFLPSADVRIYVSPQKIEDSIDLKLDKNVSSFDVSSRTIPAKEIKKDVTGEKTISVTGTKVVGDKAKGKVQIYRTGDEIELPKGTKLQSSSGLVFTLDENVLVSSGSASTPSKTEASITALDIGSEYNLSSGESFSVGNYAVSTIEAKNEESFLGGSSREIKAVSQKDYDNLLTDLKKELESKFLADIGSNLTENEMLVKESLTDEVKEKKYDRKVGDEADSLKLNLTISASVYVVDKSIFYELSKEVFKEKIPSGYVLRQDQLKVNFSYIEDKEGNSVFRTNLVANLLPKINQEEIAKSISGRSTKAAKEFLVSVQGYDRAEIIIRPRPISDRLTILPHVPKKISIEVEASP